MNYFPRIDKIKYEGPETANMFAFRHYDAEEVVPRQENERPFTVCDCLLAYYDTRWFRSFRGTGQSAHLVR